MRTVRQFTAAVAVSAHLLSACSSASTSVYDPVPQLTLKPAGEVQVPPGRTSTELIVNITGDSSKVLDANGRAKIVVTAVERDKSFALEFQNQALALYALEPGPYKILAIGPYYCRNVDFSISAFRPAVALGSISLNISSSDLTVESAPATTDEVDKVANELRISSSEVWRYRALTKIDAACSEEPFKEKSRSGDWDSLSDGEKALVVLGGAAAVIVLVPLVLLGALAADMNH